jgi:hypothetical protein
MRLFKFAAAGACAASMVAASAAVAAPTTHSAAALAPTQASLRTSTKLAHKSHQSEGGSQALGYGLAAVVAAGIVGAVIIGTDNSNNYKTPASPG